MYTSYQVRIPLKLGDWCCVITPWVLETTEYDVILGRDWLKHVNPTIDWVTGRMCIKGYGTKSTTVYPINLHCRIDSDSDSEASVNLISAKQLRRTLRKGRQEAWLFIIHLLKKDEETSMDPC
jgi:hypothetical protein